MTGRPCGPCAPLSGVTLLPAGARRAHTDRLLAVAATGDLGEPLGAALDRHGVIPPPARLDEQDLASLPEITALLAELDGLAGPIARLLLRWLVQLPDAARADPWVSAAVVDLALRAARDARQTRQHDLARGLYAAAAAAATGDEQSRAQVLEAAADHLRACGYADDAARLTR